MYIDIFPIPEHLAGLDPFYFEFPDDYDVTLALAILSGKATITRVNWQKEGF